MKFLLRFFRFPFYPVLLGIYPFTFLLSVNLGQIRPALILSSVGISLLFSVLVMAVCLVTNRELHKGGLIAGVTLLAFFSYGQMLDLISSIEFSGVEIGFWKLLVIYFIGLVLAIWLIHKVKVNFADTTIIGNVIIGSLLLLSLFQIFSYEFQTKRSEPEQKVAAVEIDRNTQPRPDIYYIVLDGYTSSDILLEQMGYDNSAFISALKSRGFYFPDCAFSNYPSTSLSMASSMNMNYLEELGFKSSDFFSGDGNPIFESVTHQNQIRHLLAKYGYKFAAFKGFFPINDIQDADYYFNYSEEQSGQIDLSERNFQYLAVKTTMLRVFVEMVEMDPDDPFWKQIPLPIYSVINPNGDQFSSRSYQWYAQHLYTFDKLQSIPALPGHKFTYAHIYATHQPYVFEANGNFLWPINEDNDGYVAAVEYVSKRMIEVVDTILKQSSVPPIIIIQADHGHSTGLDQYKILNAYYLPGLKETPPSTITPVNTFRLILKNYFDEPYDLLPDVVKVGDQSTNPPTVKDLPVTCGN